MPDSIRLRLTLWYALALAVFLIAFAGGSYGLLARATARRLDATLQETARTVAVAWVAQRAAAPGPLGEPAEVVGRFGAGDLQITVFDAADRIVAASPALPRGARPDLLALLGRDARARGAFATLPGPSAPRRAFAMPFQAAERRLIVVAAQGLGEQEAMLRATRDTYAIAVPLALALALAGGYTLARRALAPVGAMAARARHISASTLHERLPVGNERDELGQLARLLNELLARLERTFGLQRQFVADASHELRRPAAVIRGEAEVALLRPHRPEPEYREALDIIHDEARRMSRLVDDLFLLTRADAGQHPLSTAPLDLAALVGDAVRAVRTLAAARGMELRYHADPATMPTHGDESLLRRLVTNLLDNAIKYGAAGTPVVVRAWRDRAGKNVITVRNEGPPIPHEIRGRLFDRFYRGPGAPTDVHSDAGGGAGLGLAIARWIAGAHGGHLDLASSDAEGTVFRVMLPG